MEEGSGPNASALTNITKYEVGLTDTSFIIFNGAHVPLSDRSALPCPIDCGDETIIKRSGMVQYAPWHTPENEDEGNPVIIYVVLAVIVVYALFKS